MDLMWWKMGGFTVGQLGFFVSNEMERRKTPSYHNHFLRGGEGELFLLFSFALVSMKGFGYLYGHLHIHTHENKECHSSFPTILTIIKGEKWFYLRV